MNCASVKRVYLFRFVLTTNPIKLVSVCLPVLSSGAMKSTCLSKLVTILLLAAFLVTSVGSLFGYAWCVGDDGHVEVSYATGNGCCDDDRKQGAANQYDVPSVSRSSGDHCGLCLDFSAQQSEAVFFKRVKRTSMVSVEALPQISSIPNIIQSIQLVADNAVSQLPPRIAQTILAHRTVVLLN